MLGAILTVQVNGADMKVSDAIDVLTFLAYFATVNSNSRPRSRQYLDFLNTMAEQTAKENRAGNIIVP